MVKLVNFSLNDEADKVRDELSSGRPSMSAVSARGLWDEVGVDDGAEVIYVNKSSDNDNSRSRDQQPLSHVTTLAVFVSWSSDSLTMQRTVCEAGTRFKRFKRDSLELRAVGTYVRIRVLGRSGDHDGWVGANQVQTR